MSGIVHGEKSPLAGGRVRLKAAAYHPQVPDFGGSVILIEDWHDRVVGRSWRDCSGNPAALIYGLRAGMRLLPPDDEVLYGKIDNAGHLVHVSELEVSEVAG